MGWLQIRLHLKDLFIAKLDAEGASGRDRKMSSSSTGSMKSKWISAFKNLKKTSGPSNGTSPKEEKKNGRDGGLIGMEPTAHQFQEYTYKKITPCDVCSQVLRGHTKQGLKCRVCKLNVHLDCQDKVGRCQAKSRLLRRQKSTSEIETRVTLAQEEEDYGIPSPLPSNEAYRKRRLFGGVKSFSMFGNRSSSQGRSISLPEKQAQYAAGTRPFGQPLVLGGGQENGDSDMPSPIPQKKGGNKKR